jgi:hypothetical protein
MGFSNFFILNVIGCVVDAVINSFTVFTTNTSPQSGTSKIYSTVTFIRYIFAVLLPTINLKQALGNIELHENSACIAASNAILGTQFSTTGSLIATNKPGVGTQLIIFIVQIAFWWVMLVVVEHCSRVRKARQGCCCGRDSSNSMLSEQLDTSVGIFLMIHIHFTNTLDEHQ